METSTHICALYGGPYVALSNSNNGHVVLSILRNRHVKFKYKPPCPMSILLKIPYRMSLAPTGAFVVESMAIIIYSTTRVDGTLSQGLRCSFFSTRDGWEASYWLWR